MKIFTALGLDRYVCIYVADLSNEDSMNNIKKQELGFDGAYSTLVILHIPDKKQTYQNVCNLLNANSYFRNEDYHTNKDTDTEFASLNIGCNNLMSKEQMNEMAEEIGFINVKYVNYQKEWSKFVQKRASTLQDLANEKFKLGKGVSSQKLQFVIAVDDYFTNKSGDGGVFLMQKKVF
ncbi:phosphoethanolamine methyltransferase [Anaeramoeba flamelloides]|nr:phosphoethanolamine methyltransferase [Anaeramoeba flamelloides]